LLIKYADSYNFGSHDALIAGTTITLQEIKNIALTLVTSERGLKAVLKEENIHCIDPLYLE
jgi:hypothetical protein